MIHGTVKSTTWGRENQIVLIVEVDSANEDVRQYAVGQRLAIAAIPDDREIQRAYERGKAEGRAQEVWDLEAHLRRRDHE